MSDSSPKIVTVNAGNQEELQERRRHRFLKKAFLKARDRRKNFERGELAGFIYCLALAAIVVSASGQLNHIELGTWQRVCFGAFGVNCLITKTILKRRFWKQTEDAEYKEEEHVTNHRRKRQTNSIGKGERGTES